MISVVIPVYNIEHYVTNAVNSVRSQSYTDWEIILVDDGSTDGSTAMCDFLSSQDTRVVTIHKTNGGLSSARNTGIRASKGDYLMLLDGDDYLHQDALRLLHGISEKYPELDFIQFRYKEVNDYNQTHCSIDVNDLEVVTSEEEMFSRLFSLGGVAASACTKFYRRSVFQNNMFKEGILHEDEDFTTRLLSKSSCVGYCSSELYYYVSRPGSIVHTSFTPQRMDAISVVEDRLEYLKFKGYNDLVQKNNARLASMLFEFYQLAKSSNYSDLTAQINDKFSSIQFVGNSYMSKRVKLVGCMSSWCDSLKWYACCNRLIQPVFKKIRNANTKIKTRYVCWKRRRQLKYKDFTIISNNCWGGLVYQYFGLPYKSPTVGLFIMDDDYIKFLEHFNYYIDQPLHFIEFNSSRYHDYLSRESSSKSDYPIALLDDVEIHFLHYKTKEEAETKWHRRCSRINRNRMLVKMSQRYVHTTEIIERFAALPFPNKICFTETDYPRQGFIKIEELKKLNIQGGDETPFVMQKVDLTEIVNNLK